MKFPVKPFISLLALSVLSGCGAGEGGPEAKPLPVASNGPAADYPMVLGDPFTIDGVTYTPADRWNYDAVGYASQGANGGGVTAAHRTLPLPSYVEVTSLDSGKTVLVRLERRGPMSGEGLVELSPGAAAQLGLSGNPKAPVRVRRVNPAELERALLRGGQGAPDRMETPKPLLAVLMRKLNPHAPAVVPSPAPAALPVTKPTAAPKPAAKPAPAIVAVPRPAVTPAPRPVTPRPAATPAAVSPPARTGTLVIQAGAFSSRERANAVAAKIGGHVEASGRLFRVRSGPFANRAEADAALAKARAAGYSDARIQRAD